MTEDDYRRALDAAIQERETLGAERGRIDARLARLAQTIGSLMQLCGLSPSVQWGLTDSVRAVLQADAHGLTPLQVRERLTAMGFDLGRYASDLAAIHTVLKRLGESGQARSVSGADGRTAYRWSGPRPIIIHESELRALIDPGVSPVLPRKGKPK